jgi:hypothetical protein
MPPFPQFLYKKASLSGTCQTKDNFVERFSQKYFVRQDFCEKGNVERFWRKQYLAKMEKDIFFYSIYVGS